jgi:hypothetical protein
MESSLYDGVLFCVYGATDFVLFTRHDSPLVSQATELEAIFDAGRGAVVSGRENAFVSDNDCTNVVSPACRAFRHKESDFGKVLVPGKSLL